MAWEKKDIIDYIYNSKSLVLATVAEDNTPQLRSIGGYGVEEYNIYFATAKDSDKVAQIAGNPNVVLLFRQEGQQVPKNVSIYGKAEALEGEAYENAIEIIKKRRPQLPLNEDKVVYHIKPEKIKVLDFTATLPVQVVEL